MGTSSGFLLCSPFTVELVLLQQSHCSQAQIHAQTTCPGLPRLTLSRLAPGQVCWDKTTDLCFPCSPPPGPGRWDPTFPEQHVPWVRAIPSLSQSGPDSRGRPRKQLSGIVSRPVQLGKIYFAKLLLSQGQGRHTWYISPSLSRAGGTQDGPRIPANPGGNAFFWLVRLKKCTAPLPRGLLHHPGSSPASQHNPSTRRSHPWIHPSSLRREHSRQQPPG